MQHKNATQYILKTRRGFSTNYKILSLCIFYTFSTLLIEFFYLSYNPILSFATNILNITSVNINSPFSFPLKVSKQHEKYKLAFLPNHRYVILNTNF